MTTDSDTPADAGNNIVSPPRHVRREMREDQQRHKGMVFWFTGLSGSGKSTLAHEVEKELFQLGCNVLVLDGDRIRGGLCSDLGFSPEARAENLRRTSHAAKLFVEHGFICLCSFISPTAAGRERAREIIGAEDFREIYISCTLNTCEERDIKGFYKLAREGKIKNYTGISSPYEIPVSPGLVVDTDECSIAEGVRRLMEYIRSQIRLGKD